MAVQPERQRQRQSRQSGLKDFFGQASRDRSRSARPLCDSCSTPSSWEDSFIGYTPPAEMPMSGVDSLEDMMDWPKHYREALQSSLPQGAMEFLRERMEHTSYSTTFPGVDAPGSATQSAFWLRFLNAENSCLHRQ